LPPRHGEKVKEEGNRLEKQRKMEKKIRKERGLDTREKLKS
jgi:hypothetical protein